MVACESCGAWGCVRFPDELGMLCLSCAYGHRLCRDQLSAIQARRSLESNTPPPPTVAPELL
jgi:hypothetical protein